MTPFNDWLQIGTLTLAGLRDLAEEAGESKTAPAEAAEAAEPAEPADAEEPQEAAVAAAVKLPADNTRPSTPLQEEEKIAPRTPDRQSLPNIPRPPSPTALTTPIMVKPVKVRLACKIRTSADLSIAAHPRAACLWCCCSAKIQKQPMTARLAAVRMYCVFQLPISR